MSHKKAYNNIPTDELKLFLEEKYFKYNNPSFIECDPVSIPHLFTEKRDREISGFLAASIAWGHRDLILKSAHRLVALMYDEPYDFVTSAGEKELKRFSKFVHRTFNGTDCRYFIKGLRNIYMKYYSMEDALLEGIKQSKSVRDGLIHLRLKFFELPHPVRTEKHFADVKKGAAGKRLNMFLRWMVRKDSYGVDLGIWDRIDPSMLFIPLDIHTGNTARNLGLLTRKINDWKAVEELTANLREFDPADPVKYDFSLFGTGINEGFRK